MEGPLAGQPGSDASASAPAVAAVDIEKVKAEMAALMDERIKGFQKLLAGREETIKALNTQLNEYKVAGLSEDERATLREQQLREEIDQLHAELDLKDLSREYGEEYPIFREILDAPTAKDQLEAIRKLRNPQPASAPAAPAAPVDPNNPLGVSLEAPGEGGGMTADLADRLLRSVPHVPWRRGG